MADVAPGEADGAGGRHKAGEAVDEGCLAGAVRADQADQLTLLDRHGDFVDRSQATKGDRQLLDFEEAHESSVPMARAAANGSGWTSSASAGDGGLEVSRAGRRRMRAAATTRRRVSERAPAMPSGLRMAVRISPTPPSSSVNWSPTWNQWLRAVK